jgi:putative addiction module component (TIGR02574 family)
MARGEVPATGGKTPGPATNGTSASPTARPCECPNTVKNGLSKECSIDARQFARHFLIMLTQVDIERMTIPQRMEVIDRLWASIVQSGEDVPSPAWHEDVLKERVAHVKSGKAKFYTLEEARQKLRVPKK